MWIAGLKSKFGQTVVVTDQQRPGWSRKTTASENRQIRTARLRNRFKTASKTARTSVWNNQISNTKCFKKTSNSVNKMPPSHSETEAYGQTHNGEAGMGKAIQEMDSSAVAQHRIFWRKVFLWLTKKTLGSDVLEEKMNVFTKQTFANMGRNAA